MKIRNSHTLKNITIVVLLIMLICSSGIAVWEHGLRSHAELDTKKNKGTVKAAAELVKTYQDEQNKNHTVFSPNNIRLRGIRDTIAISDGALDSTVAALNIKRKQVEEWQQVATVTSAKYLKAKDSLDSQLQEIHYYKDKYLELAYRPGKDSTDTGTFDFKYNADLTITQYSKRKWFLGSKQSFIDIYSNDARTTVNGYKNLTVKQSMPEFGLRLQLRALYSFKRNIIFPGFGFSFDYRRASIIGYSYYDNQLKAFRPSIGINYDIVRF